MLEGMTLEEAFEKYKKMIHEIAWNAKKMTCNKIESYEDLVQIATLGFIESYNNFDSKISDKFIRYSRQYMMGYVLNQIVRGGGIIKYPSYFNKIWEELEAVNFNKKSFHEIAGKLGVSVGKVKSAYENYHLKRIDSLDEPIKTEDGKTKEKYELVSYRDNMLSEVYVNIFIDSLDYINADFKKIITLKMIGFSNKEIANKIGVCEETIRRKMMKIGTSWNEYNGGELYD